MRLSRVAMAGRRLGGGLGQGGGGAAPLPPVNSVPPVVTWSPVVGTSPTITPGTWSGSPTLTYTLLRAGVAVSGAEDLTEAQAEAYVTVAADCADVSLAWRETATNGGGSASEDSNSVAFSPLLLTSVRGWYRADLGLGLSGTDVTSWADQSGIGNDLSVVGVPTYVASAIGGRPAVEFNGTTAGMARAVFSMGGTATSCTLIFVGIALSNTNSELYVAYGNSMLPRVQQFSNIARCVGPGTVVSDSTSALTSARNVAFSTNGTTQRVFVAGVQEDSDANANAGPADGEVFRIANNGAASFTHCRIAEAIVMRAAISANERTALAAYTLARYGA